MKYKYKNEADIPAEHKHLYSLKNGWWVLNVEGAEDAEKFAEFRENNVELLKLTGAKDITEAKAKLAKLKDVDPDKYADLVKKANDDETERLKKEGKLEEVHRQQMEAKEKAWNTDKTRIESEKSALQRRLETVLVDDAISASAMKKGVRPTALTDVKLRGKQVFRLEGDKVVAYDGDKQMFNIKGEPMTIDDWLDKLASGDGTHLFADSSGGGSRGGGGGGSNAGGVNPYKPGPTFNLTAQAKLEKDNPEMASRLKSAA